MRILTILQARSSSSRLPNKVMRPLLGEPMLLRQLERVKRAQQIGTLVVATSVDPSDDPLAALCDVNGINCHRGSLNDVLDRFYQAACHFNPEHVVRLTGDCPLADPEVIDRVIEEYFAAGVDYASNALEPTYPDGLDVEVFSFSALKKAWEEAQLPSEREHVTPFIHKNQNLFKVHKVKAASNLSNLRWTVDNLEDFELIEQIYEALYPSNKQFSTADVLALIQSRPELASYNKHIRRNEGYIASLAKEANSESSRIEKN